MKWELKPNSGGMMGSNLRVICDGVDLGHFYPADDAAEEKLKAALGINDETEPE